MKKLGIILASLCIVLSACKKESKPEPTPTITPTVSIETPVATETALPKEPSETEQQLRAMLATLSEVSEDGTPFNHMEKDGASGEVYFKALDNSDGDYSFMFVDHKGGSDTENEAHIDSIEWDNRTLNLSFYSFDTKAYSVKGTFTFSDDLQQGKLHVPSWKGQDGNGIQTFTFAPYDSNSTPTPSIDLPTSFTKLDWKNDLKNIAAFLEVNESTLKDPMVVDDTLVISLEKDTEDPVYIHVYANGNIQPEGKIIIGNWRTGNKYNINGLHGMIESTLTKNGLSLNISWKAYDIDPANDPIGPNDLSMISSNDGMFEINARNNTFDHDGKSMGNLLQLCTANTDNNCYDKASGWSW